ncbi:MAG: aminomethyl-transferring glycine dehydrogenase subunit GcvPA [Sphaerochaetaceae bacterium]|nr:aminomethyl-transferring glycine dehydrogenase subunit GcvPA [Sphaerochaetaceae bacterium]
MYSYIPHTFGDEKKMLEAIGVNSIDELFVDLKEGGCLLKDFLNIDEGLSEEEVIRKVKKLAKLNVQGVSFLGAGVYDHIIPSAVTSLSSLPGFVTSYTPYQAEISQGILEAFFEFQTMICSLTSLPVSNATLYDGASAAAEAASLILSSKRSCNEIIVSSTISPFSLECIKTWIKGTGNILVILPEKEGVSDFDVLEGLITNKTAGLMVQTPNKYGFFEDLTGISSIVHSFKGLFAISSDPLSLTLQKSQGQWGSDIAIGDTQSLGVPMAFGGPSAGYMAVSDALMRKIPGRIVGKTVDNQGNTAYVLTLQAREQHIKRERATSNICSNEALISIMNVIYTSQLGFKGMKEAALQSRAKAQYLFEGLKKLSFVSTKNNDFFLEFPIEFDSLERLEKFLFLLKEKGIFGGVRLYSLTKNKEDEKTLLVAVTEKRTKEELDEYLEIVGRLENE